MKTITRRAVVAGCVSAAIGTARAQGASFRIGVLNDQSGFFADAGGVGGVAAVKMAVEDFGSSVLGRPIEVLSADHQNKPDIASSIARRWFDADGVSMIVDLPNTACALPVQQLGAERSRITLITGAAGTALISKYCVPTSVQWTYDSSSLAQATVGPIVAAGGDTWFFITSDYAGGVALEEGARQALLAAGGKVVGAVRHPPASTDFSSYILQAAASGAKVIGVGSGGQDMQNVIRQASEFGVGRDGRQQLAVTVAFLTDIHGLGLEVAHRLLAPTAFYWDQSDPARAWSKRFFGRVKRMPTDTQAGNYSSTTCYLNAVKSANTSNAAPVMAAMRAAPINDFMTRNGSIRADGHMMREMFLVRVKSPAESTSEWDLCSVLSTVSAEQAAFPAAQSECRLLKA